MDGISLEDTMRMFILVFNVLICICSRGSFLKKNTTMDIQPKTTNQEKIL
jgi:hypothetical protein